MKKEVVLVALLAVAVLASGIGVVYTRHINRKWFIQLQQLNVERDNLEVER